MSGHTARVRAGNDRTSLYTEITDKLIAELEAGRIPWVQPWGTAAIKAPLAMPRNASTQRGYSGINVLILWGSVIEHGFSGQSWLTFRQALGLGGHVRKGERGTTVVYADRFTPDDERRRAAEAGEEPGAIPFLKEHAASPSLRGRVRGLICRDGLKIGGEASGARRGEPRCLDIPPEFVPATTARAFTPKSPTRS